MKAIKPAIVVPVFKRLASLKTLLSSLERAEYPSKDIVLVFRSHEGASKEVMDFCRNYTWPHGNKHWEHDSEAINLDENIRRCGDLVEQYEHIILLEDDSYASPYFYSYAQQALAFSESEIKVAQVSLYRYPFHPISGLPHHVLQDSASTYFLQKTSTRGQAYSKSQWQRFRSWLNNMPAINDSLPSYIQAYGANNWELQHNWYLTEQELYSLMPKDSLVSNTGAVGTHHSTSLDAGYFQTPLRCNEPNPSFTSFAESLLVYDAFFEIAPKAFAQLKVDHLEIDLHGYKPTSLLTNKQVLTSKTCREAIQQFGNGLKPIELNVLWSYEGSELSLCESYNLVKDVKKERLGAAKQYFGEVVDIGLHDFIRFKWLKYVDRKRRKE